jgi:hypothetical protein
MSRGISHKYYDPFIIKQIDVNNLDYIIQRANTKKGKLYKIHKNRLKFYHMCNNKLKQTELVSDSPIENHGIVKSKRKYTKNINNPRWEKQKNLNHKDSNDKVTSSSSDNESIITNSTIDECISNSNSSEISKKLVSSNNKINNNENSNKQPVQNQL